MTPPETYLAEVEARCKKATGVARMIEFCSIKHRWRKTPCPGCGGRMSYTKTTLYLDKPTIREFRHAYDCAKCAHVVEWVERIER